MKNLWDKILWNIGVVYWYCVGIYLMIKERWKMNKYLIITVVVLLGLLGGLGKLYQNERNERKRAENNVSALLTDVQYYKTENGNKAARVQQLELDKREIKKYEAELVESLKEKDIKIKRLESHTAIKTETKIEFKTIRKDSLIYVPGRDSLVEMECLEYKDPWVNFSGCYDLNDEFNATIVVPDSLDINIFRVPHNIWFIKWGVKSVDVDITSYNPYTDIKYARNLKLKRR